MAAEGDLPEEPLMAALETGTCRFPGCDRPVEAAAETVGRPSRYCELPEHNAQTAAP